MKFIQVLQIGTKVKILDNIEATITAISYECQWINANEINQEWMDEIVCKPIDIPINKMKIGF